ncbi:type II toxin-antitoxin system VapC family toxin [Geobacter argillaceus]|uniref:Ribonuclease VapC n=1 Tax=Geobacter argillaceus TaxID=345631 RepID=A0A562WSY2_9BACT|nr:type II toxin-antitoxin system VapC family toxin [Geobacter argillaceus]TWJ33497.1 ribonuclease VapC [Geobacter argillaceus]
MRYVLDACAILALIKNGDGAVMVRQALESGGNTCLVHAVNICEVYYDCLRCYGLEPAEKLLANLDKAGLVIRNDMDAEFWKAAGSLKARGRISLADCFAVVLAVREDAVMLTSDRHEFEPLLAISGFPATVQFIR